ncbi:unnamed protein product [Amoebophrya sp. A120]|nr:unnamed protein product [Amoebophrya sp. A120]|eukprot:GSA120T00011349001.1
MGRLRDDNTNTYTTTTVDLLVAASRPIPQPGRDFGNKKMTSIRDFTEDEGRAWKRAVAYNTARCSREAILLLGPAGGGKSAYRKEFLESDQGSQFVDFDGDLMRDVHGQWQEEIAAKRGDHGEDPTRLFEAMKPVAAKFKEQMLAQAVAEGRSVMLPFTFSTADSFERLQCIADAGYSVARVIVFLADFSCVRERIVQRGRQTGRQQTMGVEKYKACLKNIETVVSSLVGKRRGSSSRSTENSTASLVCRDGAQIMVRDTTDRVVSNAEHHDVLLNVSLSCQYSPEREADAILAEIRRIFGRFQKSASDIEGKDDPF